MTKKTKFTRTQKELENKRLCEKITGKRQPEPFTENTTQGVPDYSKAEVKPSPALLSSSLIRGKD